MPSQFEKAVAGNLNALYKAFGLPATCTAPDGTITGNITVRLKRDEVRQVEQPNRITGELQTGKIFVRQSEMPKVFANSRFTVEGVEAWTVQTTPETKNGEHMCTCVRKGVSGMMERRAKENA